MEDDLLFISTKYPLWLLLLKLEIYQRYLLLIRSKQFQTYTQQQFVVVSYKFNGQLI